MTSTIIPAGTPGSYLGPTGRLRRDQDGNRIPARTFITTAEIDLAELTTFSGIPVRWDADGSTGRVSYANTNL